MTAARCTIHGANGTHCGPACDFYWADDDVLVGRDYDQVCLDDADAMTGGRGRA